MKRKVLAGILAGSMLFTFTACGQKEVAEQQPTLIQEEEGASYPTVTVEYGDVVKTAEIRCEYVSTEQQSMAFAVDDKLIERVEVEVGDFVTKGQLLVALDVDNLEESIEEMEYQVKSQELKLRQTEEMKAFELESADIMYGYTEFKQSDKEALAEQKENIEKRYQTTLEDMNDKLSIMKKRLEQSKQELEEGRLYAQMDGEVAFLQDNLRGTYSSKDRKIITISDLNSCYFSTDKVEYADYFKEGSSVYISYWVDGKKNEYEVVPAQMDKWGEQIYFKPVGDEIISTGMSGNITLEIGRKEDVLCVPVQAVHETDDGLFVYLEKDGLLEMRYITIGLKGEKYAEITSGLEQGEIVALN